MFLRCKVRRKDGKQHRYWSVVENTRVARGRVVQRHVLYLGEINDTQELAWRRSMEVLEEGAARPQIELTSTYFEADLPFPEGDKRAASGTRAITGRIVCRSSLPWW